MSLQFWQLVTCGGYGKMVRIPDNVYRQIREGYDDCGADREPRCWEYAFLFVKGPPWQPRIGGRGRFVIQICPSHIRSTLKVKDELIAPSVVLSLLL